MTPQKETKREPRKTMKTENTQTDWLGVKRLADETTAVAAQNWHRSLVEVRERIEREELHMLKPLLDSADKVIGIYKEWGIVISQFEELKKELEVWRKVRP